MVTDVMKAVLPYNGLVFNHVKSWLPHCVLLCWAGPVATKIRPRRGQHHCWSNQFFPSGAKQTKGAKQVASGIGNGFRLRPKMRKEIPSIFRCTAEHKYNKRIPNNSFRCAA